MNELYALAIMQSVANHYKIDASKIQSRLRDAKICEARHVVMFALRDQLLWQYKAIARFLNRKDHGTVIHGCRKIEWMIEHDNSFQKQWGVVAKRILKARRSI